jgi:hypothetical protein
MRRNRLTERDITRIARRVIKEGDEVVDNEYCNPSFYSDNLKSNYDKLQGLIDKLIEAENTTYDCDYHKYYIRQVLTTALFDVLENQILSGPHVGDEAKNFIDFLMNRYDFLKK